jgi:hypothetical protein
VCIEVGLRKAKRLEVADTLKTFSEHGILLPVQAIHRRGARVTTAEMAPADPAGFVLVVKGLSRPEERRTPFSLAPRTDDSQGRADVSVPPDEPTALQRRGPRV